VAATPKEIEPFFIWLQSNAQQHTFQTFQMHQLFIDLLYTGIGIMETMYSLMDYIQHRHPDGWIQAGIGGAFDSQLRLTEVYRIESEMLVGFGAENPDGEILDQFQLGWKDPDVAPFENGVLPCPYHIKSNLPTATGMTSFHAHGDASRFHLLQKGKTGQIENMEGAAFFYVSLMKKIPFLCFRAISNRVESRDKSKWEIPGAIQSLNHALQEWFESGEYNVDKLFGIGSH
jgi:futalosine hydrolase